MTASPAFQIAYEVASIQVSGSNLYSERMPELINYEGSLRVREPKYDVHPIFGDVLPLASNPCHSVVVSIAQRFIH